MEKEDSGVKGHPLPPPGGPKGSQGSRATFAVATSDLPKLAVVHEGFQQEITKEQAILVQKGLIEIVNGIPEEGFSETYLCRGVVKAICASPAWIPSPPAETEKILARLSRLNSGLRTAGWTVNERQDGGKENTRLVLSIDDRAIPVLESLEMRPYLGMGRAARKVLGTEPKKVGETEMETGEEAKDGKQTPIHLN